MYACARRRQGRAAEAADRLLKQWDLVAQALRTFHDAFQLRLGHLIQASAAEAISEESSAVRPRPR